MLAESTLEHVNVAYMAFYRMMFRFKVGENDLGALWLEILLQVFSPCRRFCRVRTLIFCMLLIISVLPEYDVLTMC